MGAEEDDLLGPNGPEESGSLLRFCYVNYSLSFTLKSMCSLTLIKISV